MEDNNEIMYEQRDRGMVCCLSTLFRLVRETLEINVRASKAMNTILRILKEDAQSDITDERREFIEKQIEYIEFLRVLDCTDEEELREVIEELKQKEAEYEERLERGK